MPVAPTPPTKPVPPVAPTSALPSSNTATNPHIDSSANSNPNSGTPVSPAVTGTVKELEGLTKAFQGNSSQTKNIDKAEPATKTVKQTNSLAAPTATFDSQAAVAAQTTVPNKPPALDSKPASLSLAPFVVIVGVVAVILVGLRLFKNKEKHRRTIIDNSNKTTAVVDKDGLDIIVPNQTKAPKIKSNFEFRV